MQGTWKAGLPPSPLNHFAGFGVHNQEGATFLQIDSLGRYIEVRPNALYRRIQYEKEFGGTCPLPHLPPARREIVDTIALLRSGTTRRTHPGSYLGTACIPR